MIKWNICDKAALLKLMKIFWSKVAQCLVFIMQEKMIKTKFLKTKPQVVNMIKVYYDFHYNILKVL